MSHSTGGTEARPGSTMWVPDVVGAAIATGLATYISSHLSPAASERELDLVGYGLVVVGGGSVALSRRRPRVVLGVVELVLAAYYGRQYPNGPVYAAGWFALFMISWRTDPLFMLAFLGALVLTAISGLLYLRDDDHSVLPWVAVAFALYLATVVITIAVHVPLNDDLKAAGDPERIAHLGAVRDAFHETQWVAWNVVRAVATTAAFVCLTWALVLHGRATHDEGTHPAVSADAPGRSASAPSLPQVPT